MTILSTFIHQPDIQNVLDIYAEVTPHIAKRASDALCVLLQNHYQEEGDISWQASTLTGDGFPLEFAFTSTSTDTDIRYTTEVSSILIQPEERLKLAVQRLQQLSLTNIPEELVMQLQQMQYEGSLSYGTWAGARHGLNGDSYKLYVEVPQNKIQNFQQLLTILQFPRPILADRQVLLRIVGYNLLSQQLEVYFRVHQAETYHLKQLMMFCGLGDRAEELRDFLEQNYGFSLRDKLPGGSIGFSYSLAPNGSLPVFTLFLFARAFWGGDANIRRRFSTLLANRGWDTTPYQHLTKPLERRNTWATYHGLLGFGVRDKGDIAMSIGVRPWQG